MPADGVAISVQNPAQDYDFRILVPGQVCQKANFSGKRREFYKEIERNATVDTLLHNIP